MHAAGSSSSAAKPAPSQLQPSALASESETLTLHEVARKLSEDAMQEGAEELLQDTRILQRWKQSKKASNKVRDDMLKLGSHWNVARNVNRNKRPVSEVAKDLEEAILKKARGMLQSSVEKPGPGMRSEFMGGEHDVDDEAEIPEEDLGLRAPPQLAKITLDAATSILRRDDEIAAAQKPGRHREADLQMKLFAKKFESTLNASMPRLAYAQADASPKLLGANAKAALAHQKAVRRACLLYTSPSPRDGLLSRMPSSA